MKLSCALIVFAILASPATAQIGETREELTARYGSPKDVGGGRERFKDGDFLVYPSYENGVCWRVRFTLSNGDYLADAKAILQRLSEGKSWELSGLNTGETSAKWTRSDGILVAEVSQETEGYRSRDDYDSWEVNYLTITDENVRVTRTERRREEARLADEKARRSRPWILSGFALTAWFLWKRRKKLKRKTLGGLCIVGAFIPPYLGIVTGLVNPSSSRILDLGLLLWVVFAISAGITICQSSEPREST